MMMKFDFHLIEDLPKLGWCARIEEGSPIVAVAHGPWVETGEAFFVEGAWDGDFSEGRFDDTCLLMGSGGATAEHEIVFATPGHTLERLFSTRCRDALIVSNSLPLLLEAAGLELDVKYARYGTDLWSIGNGTHRCAKQIRTAGGQAVSLHYYCNLSVDVNLLTRELPKADPPAWKDYAEYRRFLADALARLRDNARAPARKTTYEMLVSVSSGYDSPAIAALAAEAGCRRGVTFDKGMRLSDFRDVDDSGREIGARLGLDMKELTADQCDSASPLAAAEFAASGDSFDFKFAGLEEELCRTMFLSGFHGDVIWNVHHEYVNRYFERIGPSGAGLGEFRLRVGFLHVPLAYFGAVLRQEVYDISNLPEMKPWTLGNDYDRPIPRRILEEKGIPRGMFGRTKTGSFTAVNQFLIKCALDPVKPFYRARRRERPLSTKVADLARCGVGWAKFLFRRNEQALYEIPAIGQASYVVQWGCAELQARYRATGYIEALTSRVQRTGIVAPTA